MADITKYPNPLRLFTRTRDEWFTELVESFDVPMHVFSAVRDTQLGQLMFAIETMRMKRKRAGKDPGPGLLEDENATTFIPVFKLIQQFRDFIGNEDLDLDTDAVYSDLLDDEIFAQLDDLHKSGQEWFTPLSEDRLDELYLASVDIFTKSIVEPLLATLEVEDLAALQDLIKEKDVVFAETIFNIYNPTMTEAIKAGDYKPLEDEEIRGRIFNLDDEEITVTFNEYHGRVNLLYSFLIELHRFLHDQENYSFEFEMLEPLMSLETLVMYPQPDTSRLPLIKVHLSKLSKQTSYPSVFFDVLINGYQSYSRIEEANPRLVRKLFSTLEKTMKDDSRSFWKQVTARLKRGDRSVERLIAIIWMHLRAIQTQAQHKEQQSRQAGHSHSQSHAITIRLEHIFWIAGRTYVQADSFESSYQFWSAFAAIANKQVRTKEDSLDLFYELNDLLSTTEILIDSQKQKQFIANKADQYSLIQRVLSYGLESRSDEIYDIVEEYLDILEKLLEDINPDEMHASFDIEKEQKVVDDLREYIKNPVPVDN